MCVLVVEDDCLIRMILVDGLQASGLTVREAASADDAMDMLHTLEPPLKVLVTDIHMPGRRNGIGLADYVKQNLPDVPVIFTTGRPDVLDGLGIPGDNQALVEKPYSLQALVNCVQTLLHPASPVAGTKG